MLEKKLGNPGEGGGSEQTRERSNTRLRIASLEKSAADEAAQLRSAVAGSKEVSLKPDSEANSNPNPNLEETAELRLALRGMESTTERWKGLCGELEDENGELEEEAPFAVVI